MLKKNTGRKGLVWWLKLQKGKKGDVKRKKTKIKMGKKKKRKEKQGRTRRYRKQTGKQETEVTFF